MRPEVPRLISAGSVHVLSHTRWCMVGVIQVAAEELPQVVQPQLAPAIWALHILGGSWDLVSKVISTLSGVISNYKYGYLIYNPSY